MTVSKTTPLAALAILAGQSLASACVGCREPGSDVVARESTTVAAGVAFSSSVIFMLLMVLIVLSGLCAYIWKTCRRLEEERAAA